MRFVFKEFRHGPYKYDPNMDTISELAIIHVPVKIS